MNGLCIFIEIFGLENARSNQQCATEKNEFAPVFGIPKFAKVSIPTNRDPPSKRPNLLSPSSDACGTSKGTFFCAMNVHFTFPSPLYISSSGLHRSAGSIFLRPIVP